MGYGFGASFYRQNWGKVNALYDQIKDIMREENREKTAALQASIMGWIYSGNFRRKRSTWLLNRASNKGWILKR